VSAFDAGMHVVDVTYMEGYPMLEGLRLAKAEQVRLFVCLPLHYGQSTALPLQHR
jgi:hypothetical protein